MRFIIAALVLVTFAHASRAESVVKCYDRAYLHNTLANKQNEAPIFTGAASQFGHTLALYTSGLGGTWTLVVYMPDNKIACRVHAGTDFALTPIVEEFH